ncbi:response regulator [Pandoraea pnomenusa]|uniref:Transcriptional regulatory protein DevR (DosR) n=2 Tax=Burkholderiaceae TaxID=119060 RepID=A0ABY6WGP4_9BURK|nr:response regulator transcription factor [Pandoraea pnomenusa]VVE63626.1 Transcriptional regulatory protein DevR (DosR) [Pandoraea pnomenusa]
MPGDGRDPVGRHFHPVRTVEVEFWKSRTLIQECDIIPRIVDAGYLQARFRASPQMPTVFLIDDHAMFREGLLLALRAGTSELDFEAFSDGESAVAALAGRPDVRAVMSDYYLPDLAGAALLARLRATRPDLRLLVISASEDRQDVRSALIAGAHGFVHKSADSHTLIGALRAVLRGERYFPAGLGDCDVENDALAGPRTPGDGTEFSDDRSIAERLSGLTPRQREVLLLVCDGLRNGEIAARLGMTEKTVKAHVSAVLAGLGALNRTQAATLARRGGLLGKPS